MSDKLVKTAQFKGSFPSVKSMPDFPHPEFAFIGRSNVGKSSLINMLTGRKDLALTSSKPGKTRHIVSFLCNQNVMLIDLPGYGYAKTSKTMRFEMTQMVHDYLIKRPNLYCLFVLIDLRIEPQNIDIEFLAWCALNEVPFMIVFTKSEKMKPNQIQEALDHYQRVLAKEWEDFPPFFITSSITSQGRDEIWSFINKGLKKIQHS